MSALLEHVLDASRPSVQGRVARVVGLNLEIDGLQLPIGASVRVQGEAGDVIAEVVAVHQDGLVCMPLGELRGVRSGDPAAAAHGATEIPIGPALLGRVLDGLGRPIDGGPSLRHVPRVSVDHAAPHPLTRKMIRESLPLGVRALDTLMPCGRGQRMGIFAGSGVGKSTLLSMITRGTEASVTVLALVGERGREVREFIENDLGPEGLARAVVVVATSDEPALVRLRAAFTATRIAESFRDSGQDVLLLMDSLTRFAMAQREVGLSAGEPPATRGYPPSVFAMLPRLLERAGASDVGSITGLYTVLVEGDDMLDPIGDATRAILDGHIVLSRALATSGHFPSIDVLESISRVGPAITTREQRAAATEMRRLLAAYREAKDLIEIGAYVSGTNPLVDRAVQLREAMDGFLRQDLHEATPTMDAWEWLERLVGGPPG
ncbi:MAG: flagellum-specific synthase [Actinomycetota bacterium]|jgi:flagellum-specific ATP synthase|nr:flagellum-specific synthase [Actinomycetota bacterium]